MDVSIIIINYNSFIITKNAIESIFVKTNDINYEIIVVDNNSKDGSGILLKKYFKERIIYIQSNENIGFGKANNLAIKKAKGRNIFFLNSDVILLNNAVNILSKYLDKNINVGVCGGNLYDKNGLQNFSFYRCLPSIMFELNTLLGYFPFKIMYGKNLYFNNTGRPLKVAYITGADMMIKKSVFCNIGGFDPEFFMYYEDTELVYRLSKAGFYSYSVPDALMVHLEGRSFKNEISKKIATLSGRKIYYKKTHNYLEQAIVFLIRSLIVMFGFIIAIIKNDKKNYYYWLSAWRMI
ncbi:MAG: glycosyltransferase family 2 protein [Methanobrevibacter sp.]|nr:glycosyltransferase family 2 protein [Methanobrevibacter sp.]